MFYSLQRKYTFFFCMVIILNSFSSLFSTYKILSQKQNVKQRAAARRVSVFSFIYYYFFFQSNAGILKMSMLQCVYAPHLYAYLFGVPISINTLLRQIPSLIFRWCNRIYSKRKKKYNRRHSHDNSSFHYSFL